MKKWRKRAGGIGWVLCDSVKSFYENLNEGEATLHIFAVNPVVDSDDNPITNLNICKMYRITIEELK